MLTASARTFPGYGVPADSNYIVAKLNHFTWHVTVGNAGADVGLVCKGCGSQVVMDEQGGSKPSDQVFALSS